MIGGGLLILCNMEYFNAEKARTMVKIHNNDLVSSLMSAIYNEAATGGEMIPVRFQMGLKMKKHFIDLGFNVIDEKLEGIHHSICWSSEN